jgi:hypothetical protein
MSFIASGGCAPLRGAFALVNYHGGSSNRPINSVATTIVKGLLLVLTSAVTTKQEFEPVNPIVNHVAS